MKKKYIAPELETIKFLLEDIITHSGATSEYESSGSGEFVEGDDEWWGTP